MSRLKELIEQLCPDGVEYKRLDELFDIRGGYTPSKKNSEFWENGIHPWFVMEDIRRDGFVLTDSAAHVTDAALKKNGLFPAYSIIVATSATIGVHALVTVDFLCNQRFACMTRKPEIVDELDIYFAHQAFFALDRWCLENTDLGNFATVNSQALKAYRIPVPPIEVQREIVRILDAMQELDDALSKEIEVRERQFEVIASSVYARLRSDKNRVVLLGDIASKVSSGKTKERLEKGQYLVYGSTGPIAYCNSPAYSGRAILVARVGANCGLVHCAEGDYGVTDNTLIVVLKDDVSFDFALQQLQCMNINSLAVGGGQPLITGAVLKKVELVLPDYESQVGLSRKLSELKSLLIEIKRERSARREQYEYYRDKLLNLPEKETVA